MSGYLGYQIRRPFALGALASVYEAVASAGGAGRFALKVFHPPASTDVRRLFAIEGWLVAAERQQAVARAGGPAVEILGFGRCPEGAFVVMPWQERSLETLAGTLHAKGDFLRAVAAHLLDALAAWETHAGAPHGRLQPSNVFITSGADLSEFSYSLSDPWFAPGAKVAELRRKDLNAIGSILAQIVRRRGVAGWPIEEAPEWRRLGHSGEAWRAYCNYLLNPHAGGVNSPRELQDTLQPAGWGRPAPKGKPVPADSNGPGRSVLAGELTLAGARQRLQQIPRDPRPVRRTLVTTGVGVALVAGSVTGFARWGDPQVMPHRLRRLAEITGNPRAFRTEITPDWGKLCRAWAGWIGDVLRNGDRWERTGELWAPNDPLRAALRSFRADAANLRPQAIVSAAENETRLGVLADAPPEPVRRELLRGTIADRVTEVWNQVDELSRLMETWPRWTELRRLSSEFSARGFTRAAANVSSRLPPVIAPGTAALEPARVLALFNDLSLDDAGSLSLAQRWREIGQLTAAMTSSGDRVQAAMPSLVLASLTDRPSLGDFADSLVGPLDELKRRRAEFLDPAVVRERFLRESELLKETTPLTPADFARWEHELALYSRVPVAEDPRAAAEFDARIARMVASASDLEPETTPGEGDSALNRASFAVEAQRVRSDLQALRGREIVRRELPEAAVGAERFGVALRDLEQRLETSLAQQRPDTWLRRVAGPVGQLAASIRRWNAWHDAALSGVTADILRADRARFRTVRAQERELRTWLQGMEGATGFGGVPAPEYGTASRDTAQALTGVEHTLREEAAEEVTKAAEWRNNVPVVGWPAVPAPVRAPLEAHKQWVAEVPQFAGNLDGLGRLLGDGRGWTEGVQEVTEQIDSRRGVQALSGPPAQWVQQAHQLASLARSTDHAALANAVQQGGLSQRLTAWRRLLGLGDWPAGATDLELGATMVAVLRDAVSRDIADNSRRQAITGEIARGARDVWVRAARESVRGNVDVAAVFDRMGRFGVDERSLEGPMAYNLRLWRLKQEAEKETDIEVLRRHRDEFTTAVQALGVLTSAPEAQAFLQKLGKIELSLDLVENVAQAAADRSGLGSLLKRVDPRRLLKGATRQPTLSPRAAGWNEEPADAGLRMTATWNSGGRAVKLDFLLVQPDDATPPFYLAQRVVAVGEFLDLIAGRPEDGQKVLAALPAWTRSDTLDKPWNKPMAWRPRSDFRGLELNPTWFYLTDAQVKALLDNADLRARTPVLDRLVTDKPTLRSPLQQLPPEAAQVFARTLLGARLPRPDEWRAVARQAAASAPAAHLRGRSFEELWHFLDQYREGGQTVRWRPNEGVFLPLVATPDGGPRRLLADDGRARPDSSIDGLWLAPVDDGPTTGGFVNLIGNVWIYLYDDAARQFYVGGGSALSPPGLDITEPLKVEAAGRIGARAVTEGFSDVGLRPAFDAPPGVRERFELLRLVREQKYLVF